MYTVSKSFSFCYGHRLFGDEGRCRHLHGHTARATIILGGEALDEHGMLFHFDLVKERMGRWISEHLDHTLLLAEGDPAVSVLAAAGERFRALPFSPTAENIARMIFEEARRLGLPAVHVELWESETSKATYGNG